MCHTTPLLPSFCPYPPSFYELSQHHDDVRVLFPHHAPEVVESCRKGSLRRDVGSPHPMALHGRKGESGGEEERGCQGEDACAGKSLLLDIKCAN